MADQIHTKRDELASITPEVWSARFYPTLKEKLVFADSISDDYENEIQNLGDTVNITDFPQFDTAYEIMEDEKADADAITPNTQKLLIDKQTVKDFIITTRATRQALSVDDELSELANFAILKRMEELIIEETVPELSKQISYDSGTTLALADILEAKELLDQDDVEEMGRTMIVGAAQQNDIFNITGFVSRDFIPAGSPITEGAIRTPLLGFDFKWTTMAGNVSRFFHPIYQTMAVQERPTPKEFDLGAEGRRAKRVNMTTLWGRKQLSDKRVVSVS